MFDAYISKWDVSSVTDMTHMFAGAMVFNADILKWGMSGATDMTHMFDGAMMFWLWYLEVGRVKCHWARQSKEKKTKEKQTNEKQDQKQ